MHGNVEQLKEREELIFRSSDGKFLANLIQLDALLVKIKLEGKLAFEISLNLINYLDTIIGDNQRLNNGDPVCYGIIDVTHLIAIDYKAKKTLQRAMVRYFSRKKFKYIAVVSPDNLLFSLGAYVNKVRRQSPVSFHRSEQSALNMIYQQKLLNNDATVEPGSSLVFNDTWFTKKYIQFEDKKLNLEHLKTDAIYPGESPYDHGAFLLDGKVLYYRSSGFLRADHIDELTKLTIQALVENNQVKVIIDFSEVAGIQHSARKLLEKMEKEFLAFGEVGYIILSGTLLRIHNLYRLFKDGNSGSLQVVQNPTDAMRMALKAYTPVGAPVIEGTDEEMPDLQSLSKKELIDLAMQLRQENRELKTNQKDRINYLFKTISRISWDEEFIPTPMALENEADPFFDLFNAVSLLQQDVFDMLEELKELNKDLEQKVAVRTKEIADKEANLSSLIENTKDLICSVDKNYNLLVANSAYKRFIKETYKEEIKPGDNILQGLEEEIVGYWKPYYDRALSGETFEIVESRLINSRKAFFEILFNPIRGKEGVVSGFSVFIREITQQKEAEETIRRSQQLLASINHNIKEGIYRSNENKQIIYVNPAFVEMFGYESENEVYASSFSDLYLASEDRQRLINAVKKEGRITNSEIRFKRKDGSYFWGLITSIRVIDEKGNEFYDGAIRDITALKETEDKQKRQNEELKKVNRELDRFVYSASHDLRAPLLSILGLISIAKLENTEEAKNDCLAMMEKSIKKLDSFIQDIINYSRNKRLLIARDKIEFENLVKEIFSDLQYLKKSPQIEKIVKVDLPFEFYSDLRRLKIVLYNLISNAIIYSASVRESFVEVTVSPAQKDNGVLICVNDNGLGISDFHQERIFEMFYRASEEEAGSGLGLYIVKETVETLEGHIDVQSAVGKGASFLVKLPNLK